MPTHYSDLARARDELLLLLDAASVEANNRRSIRDLPELQRAIHVFLDVLVDVPGGREEIDTRAAFVKSQAGRGTPLAAATAKAAPALEQLREIFSPDEDDHATVGSYSPTLDSALATARAWPSSRQQEIGEEGQLYTPTLVAEIVAAHESVESLLAWDGMPEEIRVPLQAWKKALWVVASKGHLMAADGCRWLAHPEYLGMKEVAPTVVDAIQRAVEALADWAEGEAKTELGAAAAVELKAAARTAVSEVLGELRGAPTVPASADEPDAAEVGEPETADGGVADVGEATDVKEEDGGKPPATPEPDDEKNKGGRPPEWGDLLTLHDKMKKENPKVWDQKVVSTYNQHFATPIKTEKRKKATVDILRDARDYRKKKLSV